MSLDRIELSFPIASRPDGRLVFGPRRGWWLYGINYPWIRSHYGWDIGVDDPPLDSSGTPWQSQLTISSNFESQVRADLIDIHGKGLRVMRWFLLADGRTIIEWDSNGYAIRLRQNAIARLRQIMTIISKMRSLYQKRIYLIWCLLDFNFVDNYPATPPQNHSDIMTHVGCSHPNRCKQRAFLNVLSELIEILAEEDSIIAWDLMNEPEWRASDIRPPPSNLRYGPLPNSAEMLNFFAQMIATIRQVETKHQRKRHITVGTCTHEALDWIRGWNERRGRWNVGFYQIHAYCNYWNPGNECNNVLKPVQRFKLNKPIIIGECNYRVSSTDIGVDAQCQQLRQSGRLRPLLSQYDPYEEQSMARFLQSAFNMGYAGCLAWCYYSDDCDPKNMLWDESAIPAPARNWKRVANTFTSFFSQNQPMLDIVET